MVGRAGGMERGGPPASPGGRRRPTGGGFGRLGAAGRRAVPPISRGRPRDGGDEPRNLKGYGGREVNADSQWRVGLRAARPACSSRASIRFGIRPRDSPIWLRVAADEMQGRVASSPPLPTVRRPPVGSGEAG